MRHEDEICNPFQPLVVGLYEIESGLLFSSSVCNQKLKKAFGLPKAFNFLTRK